MVAASKAQRRSTFGLRTVAGALVAAAVIAARRQAAAGEGFVAPQVSAKSLRAAGLVQRSAGPERFGAGRDQEAAAAQPWDVAVRAAAMAAAAAACLAVAVGGPTDASALQTLSGSGAKVNKDPVSLLQLALPLEETLGNDKVQRVRTLQRSIEEMKANTLLRLYDKVVTNAQDADRLVTKEKKDLLKPVSKENMAGADELATTIGSELQLLAKAVEKGMGAEAATLKDAEAAAEVIKRATNCQKLVGDLELLMLPPGYTTPVPPKEAPGLPQLKGRAMVEVTLKRPETSTEKKYSIDAEIYQEAKLKIAVDGFSAPVTAGNFIDLVDKGFYNGMKVQRADGFIIQTGDSGDKDEHGYRPAPDQKVRRIPLEVGIKGRQEPLYGETMDEARLVGKAVPKIPFQADGCISMARTEFDNDSASSQFFLFLFESDMTPGGKNFLDGRYGSFGYTIDGGEFLRQIKEGDIIESIKIIDGADKLVKA